MEKINMKTIKKASDLVTTYEQTRAGFLRLALEKNRQSVPYVQEAKTLKHEIEGLNSPDELLDLKHLRGALLAASGLSEKAINMLTEEDHNESIKNLIKDFLKPAGGDFVDELVFRFLLTKGDSLGGRMRNITGRLGEYQLIRNMIGLFAVRKITFYWLHADSLKWIAGDPEEAGIETQARGLYWTSAGKCRTLIFNLTVPTVKKNIDLCLFGAEKEELCNFGRTNSTISNPSNYIALGELKGGIDPAGADEHWKTARSALDRIDQKFSDLGLDPHLFFVGAAIESDMANEIFQLIDDGVLSKVANLTSEAQLHELSDWIISL